MTQLSFTKTFTGGTLQGISINETMRFVSRESAEEWLESARKGHTPVVGGSPYIVTSASYEADSERCSAIYANEPCGGLINAQDEDGWSRCGRCGL